MDALEGVPGVEEHRIHHHHEPAHDALYLSIGTGVLAIGAFLVSGRKACALPQVWFAGILVAALASAGALAWVSELGGLIRHVEIR